MQHKIQKINRLLPPRRFPRLKHGEIARVTIQLIFDFIKVQKADKIGENSYHSNHIIYFLTCITFNLIVGKKCYVSVD